MVWNLSNILKLVVNVLQQNRLWFLILRFLNIQFETQLKIHSTKTIKKDIWGHFYKQEYIRLKDLVY